MSTPTLHDLVDVQVRVRHLNLSLHVVDLWKLKSLAHDRDWEIWGILGRMIDNVSGGNVLARILSGKQDSVVTIQTKSMAQKILLHVEDTNIKCITLDNSRKKQKIGERVQEQRRMKCSRWTWSLRRQCSPPCKLAWVHLLSISFAMHYLGVIELRQ